MSGVPIGWVAPFAGLLLAIALLPLAAPRWWDSNRNKAIVALLFATPVAAWALRSMPAELAHTMSEYFAFVVLLGSLYTITGGMRLDGDLRATPLTNATFLGVGAVLANVVGTTGAAMLLVRPLLATNSERRNVAHTVIFFVFMVCNTGGCLTALGDPPLFVGYLQGVPFLWTLRLWPAWLGLNGALLLLYLVVDGALFLRETNRALREDILREVPLRLVGGANLIPLAGAVASIAFLPPYWREGALVLLAALSYATTPRELHEKNAFTWHPIVEVAVLFAGIFVTMTPALAWLREHAASFGVASPRSFFWATGSLSAFLDNTPTYLAFLEVARGLGLAREVPGAAIPADVLAAISLGAVFMGALTYIGNGPNFMVRSIAQSRGVAMPSFFGYMLWSVGILVPLFVVTSLLFF